MPCTDLRVRELLKERSWTTKVLAEKTGMSESYLTHIKNGTRRWNEDSLKRISEAFELEPVSLLASYKQKDNRFIDQGVSVKAAIGATSLVGVKGASLVTESSCSEILEEVPTKVVIKKVPMMGEIPSYPSEYNNKSSQVTTGYKEMFVPVVGLEGTDIFCIVVENQSMSPRFMKGDCLIIVPGIVAISGDLVAVEYKTDKLYKQIMQVSFAENLIMLEFVNHKQPPVALVKNRDYCRIIGKVSYIYQKHS